MSARFYSHSRAKSSERYSKEVLDYSRITPEREKELSQIILNSLDYQARENARTELITSNLRLVFKISNEFKRSGVPFEDLVQYGNVGLITAVDNFDYSFGTKFSTFAQYHIKNTIRLGIYENLTFIRIPHSGRKKLRELEKITQKLYSLFGREPSREELLKESGLSSSQLSSLILSSNSSIVSLNETPHFGDNLSFEEAIPDYHESILEKSQTSEQLSFLLECLSNLPESTRTLLEERFGIGVQKKTLEAIAEERGVSKNSVIRSVEQGLLCLKEVYSVYSGEQPLSFDSKVTSIPLKTHLHNEKLRLRRNRT